MTDREFTNDFKYIMQDLYKLYFGAKCTYKEILEQKLYILQGGSVLVELYLEDGTSVSLQSTLDGVYPFLDTAFAGWCMQKGIDPQACDFHDPSKHWWFPHEAD